MKMKINKKERNMVTKMRNECEYVVEEILNKLS